MESPAELPILEIIPISPLTRSERREYSHPIPIRPTRLPPVLTDTRRTPWRGCDDSPARPRPCRRPGRLASEDAMTRLQQAAAIVAGSLALAVAACTDR